MKPDEKSDAEPPKSNDDKRESEDREDGSDDRDADDSDGSWKRFKEAEEEQARKYEDPWASSLEAAEQFDED